MTFAEAERYKLVLRVVPSDRLMEKAKAVAGRVASFSAPIARMIRQVVNLVFRASLSAGLAFERRLFHLTFAAEDRRQGIAAFVEKRTPKFADR